MISKYQKVLDAMERRVANAIAHPQDRNGIVESNVFVKYKSDGRNFPSNETIRDYQTKAALSSWFAPETLYSQSMDDMDRSLVLDILEGSCEKRKTERIEWQLRKNRRDFIINDLYRSNSLKSALSEELPKTDSAGIVMRQLLGGTIFDISELSEREALDLITALELLSNTSVPVQSIEPVREKLQGKFLSQYDVLLQNYVGRTETMEKLNNYLRRTAPPYPRDIIVVTGIGGAGKSTVLAKFLHEVRDKELALISILDFDRPGVDADDKNWLLSEMLSQLAHQFPQIRHELAYAQHLLRRQINNLEQLNIKGKLQSSDVREQTSILLSIKDVLLKVASKKRWLIVFDTFEEIRSELKAKGLIDWVNELSDLLPNIAFKVIISGRLYDNDKKFKRNNKDAEVIQIDEFEKNVAVSFLQKLNVPHNAIEEIVGDDMVPLRPLELKLLARLFEDPSFDFKQLKEGANNSQFAGKDLFLGVV